MKVILTRAALRELDQALDYIAVRHPQGAQRVKAMLWSRIELLTQHPLAGHTTDRPGLRRVLALPYPYAIFTASQRRPSSSKASATRRAALKRSG